MSTDEPSFNLTLRWPDERVEVFRVHNPEPVGAVPYQALHCWGVDLALQLIGVNAQRVRSAGGQLVGTSGEPVLLVAPVSALSSWSIEPA